MYSFWLTVVSFSFVAVLAVLSIRDLVSMIFDFVYRAHGASKYLLNNYPEMAEKSFFGRVGDCAHLVTEDIFDGWAKDHLPDGFLFFGLYVAVGIIGVFPLIVVVETTTTTFPGYSGWIMIVGAVLLPLIFALFVARKIEHLPARVVRKAT